MWMNLLSACLLTWNLKTSIHFRRVSNIPPGGHIWLAIPQHPACDWNNNLILPLRSFFKIEFVGHLRMRIDLWLILILTYGQLQKTNIQDLDQSTSKRLNHSRDSNSWLSCCMATAPATMTPPKKNKNKDTFVKHRKGTTEKASSAAVSLHQLTRRWDPSMNLLADGDSDNRWQEVIM